MTSEHARFTDPVTAIDHVRRVARETAAESGYRGAAAVVMALRQEYRIMPLKRKEAPPDRVATWDAVRLETMSLAGADGDGRHQGARLVRRTHRDPGRSATPPPARLGAGPDGRPADGRAAHGDHRASAAAAHLAGRLG